MAANLLERVSASVALSLCVFIALWYIIQLYRHRKAVVAKSTVFTFLLLLFALAFCSSFNVKEHRQTKMVCLVHPRIVRSVYPLFKALMYTILLLRVHETYKEMPQFGYTKCRLLALATVNVSWCLANIYIFNVETVIIYDTSLPTPCLLDTKTTLILFSLALHDLSIGTVCCTLFVRPLCVLQNTSDHESSIRFRKLALRMCILAVCTVSSTLAGIFGTYTTGYKSVIIWTGMDLFVTVLCVVLMYHWNAGIVEFVCCCCFRCIDLKEDEAELANVVKEKEAQTGGGNDTIIDVGEKADAKPEAASMSNSSPKVVTACSAHDEAYADKVISAKQSAMRANAQSQQETENISTPAAMAE